MSLAESRGQLGKAAQDLAHRWAEVKGSWHDAQSDHFEKLYIHMIESEVRKTLSAMDQMNNVLQKIVKDCE